MELKFNAPATDEINRNAAKIAKLQFEWRWCDDKYRRSAIDRKIKQLGTRNGNLKYNM